MSSDLLVAIGQIVGVHGMDGELRVYPLTDFPDRLAQTERVYAGDKTRPRKISDARRHDRVWLVRLEGIDNRAAAEKLKGTYLLVEESELIPLPAGSYYVFHLVGCDVVGVDGSHVGRVKDAVTGTGNDLLVVSRAGGRDALVPFVREFIKQVDLAGKRITVSLIPGLIE